MAGISESLYSQNIATQARAVFVRLSSVEQRLNYVNSLLRQTTAGNRILYSLPVQFEGIPSIDIQAAYYRQVSEQSKYSITDLSNIQQRAVTVGARAQALRAQIGNFFAYSILADEQRPRPPEFNLIVTQIGLIRESLDLAIEAINQTSRLAHDLEIVLTQAATAITNPQARNQNQSNAQTVRTEDQTQQAPAPKWGVKFRITDSYTNPPQAPLLQQQGLPRETYQDFYLTLLPAMNSSLSLQGSRDVPNAQPGLQFRIIPNLGKFRIPGFQSAYQNLGMDSVMITMVGCFLGNDGADLSRVDPENYWDRQGTAVDNSPTPSSTTPLQPATQPFFRNVGPGSIFNAPAGATTPAPTQALNRTIGQLDSYRSFQEFYKFAVLAGREVEVEINTAKNTGALAQISEDKLKRMLRNSTGNPSFKCVVRSMEAYFTKADRTWYLMQLEVTDLGLASNKAIDLTNKISEGIEKAQGEREVLQQRSEAEEFRQIRKLLEDELKYEQYQTSDGCKVYEFTAGELQGQAITECLNTDGTVDYEIVTPTEVEQLRSRKTSQDVTIGDGIALVGSTAGCVIGVVTVKTVIGGVLAGVSCTAMANTMSNVRVGRTPLEGILEGGLGVLGIFGGTGSAAASLGRTVLQNSARGRSVLQGVGQATSQINSQLSGLSQAASRIPLLQGPASWLNGALNGFNTVNTLGGRIGTTPVGRSVVNNTARAKQQAEEVIRRLRGGAPAPVQGPAPATVVPLPNKGPAAPPIRTPSPLPSTPLPRP